MRHRIKSGQCLNCQLKYPAHYNYCPQCGQENTIVRVSFLQILRDLFDNYITLDSRFGRTIIPFLFRPGYLSEAFNKGKRIHYIHPVRLYILMSLLYFFVFGYVAGIKDLTIRALEGNKTATDSTGQQQNLITVQGDVDFKVNTDNSKDSKGSLRNVGNNWLLRAIQDPQMTESALLDTIKNNEINIQKIKIINNLDKIIAKQLLKIGQRDLPMFINEILSNIPLMMLIMLPLLAVMLRVIYPFAPFYYIEHFVNILYLQSFVYFIFSISMVFMGLRVLADPAIHDEWLGWCATIPHLILLLYNYKAFRRMYKQGRIMTILKLSAFTFWYATLFFIFLTLELLISFFTF
jgi:hypothetical protein